MPPLEDIFKSDRTLYILDTKDLYYIDNMEMFDYMRQHNVPYASILNIALTIVNCRLRNVEPSIWRIIESMDLYKHAEEHGVSVESLNLVVVKCIDVALDILEPHFQHLYGTHHNPSTLLCIRGIQYSTLLLGLYRVNSMDFAL